MSDTIKPDHYHYGGMDVIAFGEVNYTKGELVGFYRMNVLKYVHRYDRKNGIEDLKKAQFYLEKLVDLELKNNGEAY